MIDLLVAGGGPTGLAAAIHARLAGLEVTVVEPRPDPVDKACGEGLMPGAVARLGDLGVCPRGHPFAGIRYLDGRREAEARFRAGAGLGVRRTSLQTALAARADELGVTRIPGRVTSLRQADGRVEAAGITASWLVAADGLHSPVRRLAGLDGQPRRPPRFGLRRHFAIRPWTDLVEVYWSPRAEAYVTPVADSLVGVALLCGAGQRYDEVLDEFPALLARLRASSAVSTVRGAGPLRRDAVARRQGRLLLVGDAAGYVDALTGEGLATGLATAEAAVDCIVRGRPQDYEGRWRAATLRYRLITSALLQAAQVPVLRPHIVPAASRWPWLFARIVGLLS